ncbi:MAG TPA: sporulation integral membrane protein YtvI [Bacillota bacterium]|nr:sporulation integral membrane protein YtvI [Bacillota bacterium]
MSHKMFYPFLRLLLVIILSVLVFLIVKYTFLYLYPFLIAIFISYIMQKPILFFEGNMHLPRIWAWFLVFITGMCGIFIFIIFLTTELIQGTTFLAERIPAYFHFFASFIEDVFRTTLLPLYHKFVSLFQSLSNSHQELIMDEVNKFTDDLAANGASFIHQTLLKFPSFLALVPGSLTIILFIIMATIFISKDWDQLHRVYEKIMPKKVNHTMQRVFHQFKQTFIGYIRSQLILVFITSCIIYIGLLLLKIEHALTVAILTSFVDFLPFIGTGIVFIPWIMYLFFTDNYTLTIFISLLYMIVIVQRQLSEPKIVSSSIGLPPIVTLICLFLAWQFWGLLGIFIAPLILIILTTLIRAGVFTQIWTFIKGP